MRKNKMHYNEQRLDELEKQYAEMGETIKQMKEKTKWEPEGGDYFIATHGCVENESSHKLDSKFGTERKTREQAEKARDKMRVFNRLLAYVDEFAPDYEFVVGSDNYYLYHAYKVGEWQSGFSYYNNAGLVCMPKQTAIDLCKKLNSGEVVL